MRKEQLPSGMLLLSSFRRADRKLRGDRVQSDVEPFQQVVAREGADEHVRVVRDSGHE
jgi:hypothetical protein